ncbi:MAG: hypothetical protein COW10_07025 [Candidatus Omnitrophica bacterium CG12_big_fil_rev_8_21_14_0_65_42_8]|nr:MAG: hypothetical protein COW10_07025 [Candidatus Omnitrophica bacterium CG12_big_fil_rev_8_21_14_0_65_42_8]
MGDFTPEEKLLNLIKKDHFRAKIKKDLRIFTKINIILIGLTVILAAVFISDALIFKNKISESSLDIKLNESEVQPITNDAEVDLDMGEIDKGMAAKKISVDEIKAGLNLLGIITGDNNQAIIEDKNLKKTFFLFKGDKLGELNVYDIKESVVILEYKGEKIELNI